VLKTFETELQIEQQMSHSSRLISIVNYGSYQSSEPLSEPRVSHERATSEPPVSLKQEGKKVRHKESEKKEGMAAPLPQKPRSRVKTSKSSSNGTSGAATKALTVGSTAIYKTFMGIYRKRMTEIVGAAPQIDGSDGAAMKKVVTYFLGLTGNDDGKAASAFSVLFDNWGKLDDFTRKMVRIRQVESQLTSMINQIKNHGKQTESGRPQLTDIDPDSIQ
jgi:hypothetical protein